MMLNVTKISFTIILGERFHEVDGGFPSGLSISSLGAEALTVCRHLGGPLLQLPAHQAGRVLFPALLRV